MKKIILIMFVLSVVLFPLTVDARPHQGQGQGNGQGLGNGNANQTANDNANENAFEDRDDDQDKDKDKDKGRGKNKNKGKGLKKSEDGVPYGWSQGLKKGWKDSFPPGWSKKSDDEKEEWMDRLERAKDKVKEKARDNERDENKIEILIEYLSRMGIDIEDAEDIIIKGIDEDIPDEELKDINVMVGEKAKDVDFKKVKEEVVENIKKGVKSEELMKKIEKVLDDAGPDWWEFWK